MSQDSPEARMARLEVLLETTLNQVKGLKDDVERYFDRLGSLQIVEERNRRLEQDLNRISTQCSAHQASMDKFKEEQSEKDERSNRYIYTFSGILLACSVAWGLVGTYVSRSVADVMDVVDKQHTAETKQAEPPVATTEQPPHKP